MATRTIVIKLICEELRNKKLTDSLEDMGFDCSYYVIDLSREILLMAGFVDCPEKLFRQYFHLQEMALREIRTDNFNEMLQFWSLKIYEELLKIK